MGRIIIGVLMWAALSRAIIATADDQLSGFTTEFEGDLSGVVTDLTGHALGGELVYVVTAAGQQVIRADRDGRYHVALTGAGKKTVFVRRLARIIGQTGVSSIEGGEEVFEIQESLPPKVMPKPLTRADVIPEYSALARSSDAWAKTWMMLDVDVHGTVQRVQVIKAAGLDLDANALRAAFQQKFTPARDQADRPVPAMVLWSYEWPAYEWLLVNKYQPRYLPASAKDIPCRALTTSTHLRDCEPPDLAKGLSQPSILRPVELVATDAPAAANAARPAAPDGRVSGRPSAEAWYEDKVGWVFVGAGLTMSAAGLYFISEGAGSRDRNSSGGQLVAGYLMSAIGVSIFTAGAVRFAVHSDGASTSLSLAGDF